MARPVLLIAGGSRGIGAATARFAGERGYDVAINYVKRADAAEDVAAAVKKSGGHAVTLQGDMTKEADIIRVFGETTRALGPITHFVHSSGIGGKNSRLDAASADTIREVIDVNLGGCFNMAKALFDGMTSRGYGRIVNIGSINGQAGQYGQVNYAAAKSGIHGFTKALAQEGASKGVTVNAIAPGYIDTDMVAAVPAPVLEKIVARIPVGRLGHANEIARGVLFLVADDAGFITGSTLSINGGQHMY